MRADSGARDVRNRYIDAAILALAKVAVSLWVLRLGFSHVSDDDFARTVIAQTFAGAPKLDPSGTSWLPLPFWLTGGAMMVLGRSIAVARGVAIALGFHTHVIGLAVAVEVQVVHVRAVRVQLFLELLHLDVALEQIERAGEAEVVAW